jgi:hypothetical protein
MQPKNNHDQSAPIIVQFEDEDARNALLNSSKKLKNDDEYRGVFLVADRTLAERTRNKELVTERNEKNRTMNAEEKKSYLYVIRADTVKRIKKDLITTDDQLNQQ